MKNAQFIKILKTFSPDEIKKFRKFLLSPYFNTNKTLIKLFEHLTKKYDRFRNIDEKKVFQFLYPSKPLNKIRLRDLSSEMLGLCERFLAEDHIGADQALLELNYLKSINARDIRKNFMNKYRQIENDFKNNKLHYEYFNNLQFIYKEFLKYCNSYEIKSILDSIDEIRENTLNSSLFEMLRFNLGVAFFSYEFNKEIEQIQIGDYFELKGSRGMNLHPVIMIYYDIHTANNKFELNSYYKIKNAYSENKILMDLTVKKEILINTLNLLFRNINLISESIFKKESIELLAIMHEEGLFYDNNGYMIVGYFFTYAERLIEYSEYDKAHIFIKENRAKILQDRLSDNMVYTLLGKLYFKTGKYSRALESLDKITNSDIILYLQKKQYLLMTHYELGNYIICEELVSNLRKLFLRNKKYKCDPNRLVTFVKYFSKILISFNDKEELQTLTNLIQNEEKFSGRKWLIAKTYERIQANK